MSAYGSPAYWAQQMFSSNHGDLVLPLTAENVPTREWTPTPQQQGISASTPPTLPPQPRAVPLLFFSATRDSKTNTIYIKVVNRAETAQQVRVEFTGIGSVQPKGKLITLRSARPDDSNAITQPARITPETLDIDGLSFTFTRIFPPYSISVLVAQAARPAQAP